MTVGIDEPAERLLDPSETAAFLGLEVQTLGVWRVKGRGPDYFKVGNRVRYRWSDIEAFLAERRVTVGGNRP